MSDGFIIGQHVAVYACGSATPQKIRTVVRVMKRFVELNDGSKWDHDGHRYPRALGLIEKWIAVVDAAVLAKIHRAELWRRIEETMAVLTRDRERVSTEALETLARALVDANWMPAAKDVEK